MNKYAVKWETKARRKAQMLYTSEMRKAKQRYRERLDVVNYLTKILAEEL